MASTNRVFEQLKGLFDDLNRNSGGTILSNYHGSVADVAEIPVSDVSQTWLEVSINGLAGVPSLATVIDRYTTRPTGYRTLTATRDGRLEFTPSGEISVLIGTLDAGSSSRSVPIGVTAAGAISIYINDGQRATGSASVFRTLEIPAGLSTIYIMTQGGGQRSVSVEGINILQRIPLPPTPTWTSLTTSLLSEEQYPSENAVKNSLAWVNDKTVSAWNIYRSSAVQLPPPSSITDIGYNATSGTQLQVKFTFNGTVDLPVRVGDIVVAKRDVSAPADNTQSLNAFVFGTIVRVDVDQDLGTPGASGATSVWIQNVETSSIFPSAPLSTSLAAAYDYYVPQQFRHVHKEVFAQEAGDVASWDDTSVSRGRIYFYRLSGLSFLSEDVESQRSETQAILAGQEVNTVIGSTVINIAPTTRPGQLPLLKTGTTIVYPVGISVYPPTADTTITVTQQGVTTVLYNDSVAYTNQQTLGGDYIPIITTDGLGRFTAAMQKSAATERILSVSAIAPGFGRSEATYTLPQADPSSLISIVVEEQIEQPVVRITPISTVNYIRLTTDYAGTPTVYGGINGENGVSGTSNPFIFTYPTALAIEATDTFQVELLSYGEDDWVVVHQGILHGPPTGGGGTSAGLKTYAASWEYGVGQEDFFLEISFSPDESVTSVDLSFTRDNDGTPVVDTLPGGSPLTLQSKTTNAGDFVGPFNLTSLSPLQTVSFDMNASTGYDPADINTFVLKLTANSPSGSQDFTLILPYIDNTGSAAGQVVSKGGTPVRSQSGTTYVVASVIAEDSKGIDYSSTGQIRVKPQDFITVSGTAPTGLTTDDAGTLWFDDGS